MRLLAPAGDGAGAPDAHQVIAALLDREWRIVHIAGHGEPPERVPRPDGSSTVGDPRGVVLSHGCWLGPREIRTMRTVPELVFVNCCHLAVVADEAVLATASPASAGYDRARFASGVAEELIRIGVRCVIAAGWAVEDEPAEKFAATFYRALLAGARFIDAAAQAREAAWEARGSGNTWAAYQCWGDPDWTLHRVGQRRSASPPADKFAGISSPVGLVIALETVAVTTRFLRGGEREQRIGTQRERLRWLDERYGERWGREGKVAEAFAVAFTDLGDRERALHWYRRAVTAPDGGASQRAIELWANLRVRCTEDDVHDAARALRRAEQRAAPHPAAGGRNGEVVAQARAQLAGVLGVARATVESALGAVERLLALHATMDRMAIVGSAYKRLAMIEREAGRADAERLAVREAIARYAQAEQLGREAGADDLHYPALNRMAAELVAALLDGRDAPALAAADIDAVRASLAAKAKSDPDFWSVVGDSTLHLLEAIDRRTLAATQSALAAEYTDLHQRVSGAHLWRSVHDTARFLVDAYAPRASAAEGAAGAAILAQLETLAWED